MINNEDILNSFGRALFIVSFLLLVISFSDRQIPHNCSVPVNQNTKDFQLSDNAGLTPEGILFSGIVKNIISQIKINGPDSFIEKNKISEDSRKIFLVCKNLQKIIIARNSLAACRFYYHFFSSVADYPPLLS